MNFLLPNHFKTLAGVLLLSLLALPAMAQDGPRDTKNVRDKHLIRQGLYEKNQEAFKPPRKNNMSIGVQTGFAMISGDVRPERGQSVGINLRGALGHLVSLRGQAMTGYARGRNWRPNGGFAFNSALNGDTDAAANYFQSNAFEFVYYNYKMRWYDVNMQAVFNLGNINFYNKEPKVAFYGFIGAGGLIYTTEVDALDENGAIYDYSGIPGASTGGSQDRGIRRDVLNSLNNLLDGEYETAAESHPHKPTLFDRTLVPAAHVGVGINFKMSR
ncbi:MAG: hypothetical protein AAF570_27310, partial [Bacteroidota bacterium]